ncbi:serine protease inhibitor dipetalogastin-like, partial [Saccostrea cucullata]|uniref:serine protease inhibitor dipetalogastin-like n=1 Tax=Saccostrea cuccullata TaxID=36930 RepID=UPI002ED5CC91
MFLSGLLVCSSVLVASLARSPPSCPCPKILNPVCGDDGFIYANDCLMKCEGAQAAADSDSCCKCKKNYNPVCGVDGKSYGNKCMAFCKGVRVASRGECPRPVVCTADYTPVCGVDGVTYGNACGAQAA